MIVTTVVLYNVHFRIADIHVQESESNIVIVLSWNNRTTWTVI